MNVTAKFDDRQFKEAAERIAVFSNKSMLEVCRQQAGLFVSDAARFTPPFGDAPMTESWDVQKQIGDNAIATDIKRAFKRPADLHVVQDGTKLGKGILKLLKGRKNQQKLAKILKTLGVATGGVVPNATRELHDSIRRSNGHVRSGRFGFLVVNWKSLPRFLKIKQKFVGLGKSGWKKAVEALNQYRARKITLPSWVKRHNGQGLYVEGQAGGKTFVEVANLVPTVQKHHRVIMTRAWNNRIRNIQLQAQKQEQAMQRAAKKAGLS